MTPSTPGPDTPFCVADGSIQHLGSSPGLLRVEFIDWQQQAWVLSFTGLVAYQSLGAEGTEIAELSRAPLSQMLAQVDPGELSSAPDSYSFICAWSGRPVLSIIADDCRYDRAPQPQPGPPSSAQP